MLLISNKNLVLLVRWLLQSKEEIALDWKNHYGADFSLLIQWLFLVLSVFVWTLYLTRWVDSSSDLCRPHSSWCAWRPRWWSLESVWTGPGRWTGRLGSTGRWRLEGGRRNGFCVLGILQSPDDTGGKQQGVKVCNFVTVSFHLVAGLIKWLKPTLLIMFKVHSKTASKIFGISPVMWTPSLLTMVAMVLRTSGSRAAGTFLW